MELIRELSSGGFRWEEDRLGVEQMKINQPKNKLGDEVPALCDLAC